MASKYLRKKDTDEVFAYSPILAKRTDMEPYDKPTVEEPTEKEVQAPAKKTVELPDKDVKPLSQADTALLIREAIGILHPDKDFTDDGLPKVEALSEILGMPISETERDEAWKAYNALKESGEQGNPSK